MMGMRVTCMQKIKQQFTNLKTLITLVRIIFVYEAYQKILQ